MTSTFTTVIRNAVIYDGTGHAPIEGDLALRGDRIVQVGKVTDNFAENEVDINGLTVCPGFIDVHTHDDFAAILYPDMPFKLLGGVTTCIVGNCGMGVAPHQEAIEHARVWHPKRQLPAWQGYAGYFHLLDAHPPSLNIGVLVGHGTLRRAVMGNENRLAGQAEMAQMQQILREGLDAGALGFSTGLGYEPGCYADTEEIVELAKIMEETGGLYTTHMRDESEGLLDSIRETLQIGEQARVPVQISHHKALGRESWGTVAQSLQLVEAAQARGLDVHADQYPYTASSTRLAAILRRRVFHDGRGGERGQLAPEDVVIAASNNHPEWEGKSIKDLAQAFDLTAQHTAEHLVNEEPGTLVVFHNMSEEDVQMVMRHPSTMIGSDGVATLESKPHPRLYGTFARVLGRYARDLGLFSLEEAIYRMTGFAATTFGLTDRGHIHEQALADLVVFDPSTIIDTGTFEEPNQYPQGIAHVFVNGSHVVQNGTHSGNHPGRALRRAM